MMLQHLGEDVTADRIMAALRRVLARGRVRTRDLGGTATTTDFTAAVCTEIDSAAA
jgi:tartrate dehydrogenase/decarboxylase/D-malate dehydrogenase